MNEAGILIYRDLKRSWLLPSHWLKRLFEWHYLRVFAPDPGLFPYTGWRASFSVLS